MPLLLNPATGKLEQLGLNYVTKDTAPTTSDAAYRVPYGWLDTSSNEWYILVDVTGGVATWTKAGGDVTGPSSSTDDALVRFDGTTGKTIQNSVAILDDAGALSGLTQLDVNGDTIVYNALTVGNTVADNSFTINGAAISTTITAETDDATDLGGLCVHRHSDTAGFGGHKIILRSRGTHGAETIVQSGDVLSLEAACGFDGTDFAQAAQIRVEVDGTPGANDMPGRIIFAVSPDGSQTPAEAMRISEDKVVTLADNLEVQNILLNTSPSTPSTTEGSFYWDSTDHCITVRNDESATSLQVGQELIIRVRNESGSLISDGELTYVTGVESGGESRPLIDLAQADAELTASVIGVATHDIENNSYGYVTSYGLVRDIDTSAFASGAPLFLSETVAGAFTDTEPVSPNFAKAVGFCVVSNATTGSVLIAVTPDTTQPAGDATELTLTVRKDSAGTINDGEVVYQSGYNVGQSVILVELADADDPSTMPALGVARGSFTNSTSGTVVVSGLLTGQDTSGYSVGDQVYVDTTAGALTNTRPTAATAAVQKIGQVTRSNASNGAITVVGAGRTNDIPNHQSDAIFRIADDGDTTKLIQFQASGLTTATTRTITMPDADITLLIPSNVAITGGAIDGTTIGATTPAAGTFDFLTLDDISGSYADSEQVFRQAGVQTTDATPTQIAAITLATNTMVSVEARINGFKNDYSASCGGKVFYVARRVAGSAVEVGTPVVDVIEDSASAPTVDADVSGNDVRLLVTGVGSETWNWVVSYNYHFTKTNA